MPTDAVLAELKLHSSGKVREMYEVGDDLLMVASDRISAYDVVLPTPIPDKGRVLTQMSVFWFETTGDIVPNHLISPRTSPTEVAGRALLRQAARDVPGRVRRPRLPVGLGLARVPRDRRGLRDRAARAACASPTSCPSRSSRPATKAEIGDHDENIDFDRAVELIGDRPLMEELRRVTLELYAHAADHAAERGIIIADTKFEFGSSPGAEVVLGDEVLTPDSSRFWPADDYEPGRSQASFDKQYVRDWLDQSGWDHTPPGPELPDEVVANTRAKYVEAYERITGRSLA